MTFGVLRPAAMLLGVLTLTTGVVYPLGMTGLAAALFARQASGSLITQAGHLRGSSLIGQAFSSPGYFWGRPSATLPQPYNALASTGSNLGPLNPALTDAVRSRLDVLRSADPGNAGPVPPDLVTASASGLDPHISVTAARYQVGRVAAARGIEPARVSALVAAHVEAPLFGFLGEARVNVLELNLALDALR